MILLSVGTQFPFDRLVCAVDEWATKRGRDDIVAQIGPSKYVPRMLKCFSLISPDEFRQLQSEASVVIAHAGMGSILTCMEFGKPIIIMPRDHTLGEHRNGHQIATAKRFGDTPGVYVVRDEEALLSRLDHLDDLVAASNASDKAPQSFVSRLQSFIDEDKPSRWGLTSGVNNREGGR